MGHATAPGTYSTPHPKARPIPQFDSIAVSYPAISAEPNYGMALSLGVLATLGAAVVWAIITGMSGWQIGYMAVGVGFLVGLAVRSQAPTGSQGLALVSASLALTGCLIGNLFTGCYFIASENSVGVFEVIGSLDFSVASGVIGAMFSPIDLIFYGIAVYEAYTIVANE